MTLPFGPRLSAFFVLALLVGISSFAGASSPQGVADPAVAVPPGSASAPPGTAPLVVAVPPGSDGFSSDRERAISTAIAAEATPRPLPSPFEPTPRYRFYGWQVMAVEGAGSTVVGLLALLAAVDTGGGGGGGGGDGLAFVAGAGVLAYAGGGAIVHLAHGHGFKALGSLGFTIGLPLTGLGIGAAAGAASCKGDQGDCVDVGMAVGALVGGFVAPIVDGLALGWERREPASPEVPVGVVVPFAAPVPGGATLGLAGSF